MNKTEFIRELKLKLAKLSDTEINKTISFYTESIDDRIEDGMSEEAAVASLGEIDKIVSEISIDIPLATLIQSKIRESHNKATNKTLWIVLAICGFPLWLPVGLALISTLLAVYISVWAVIISLYAVELALLIAGIVGLLLGFITCFTQNTPAGFALIGMSVAAIGLFIMSIKPLLWLCKQYIILTTAFLRKIKTLFISQQGDN